MKSVVKRAIEKLVSSHELETVLQLISGVRVIRIRSNKKNIFKELSFSIRKGHILKAQTTSESRWGKKLVEVTKI